jgi:uncharacterized protein (DUF1697 family)
MEISQTPHRYFAFLRAINVGGHTVKMDKLCDLFAKLGYLAVESFIASGNIVFLAPLNPTIEMEAHISQHLERSLGFPVAVFLRTSAELSHICQYQPFSAAETANAKAFNIAFLAQPLSDIAQKRLVAFENDIDRFQVHDREVYWLCQTNQSDSKFSNAVLEKAISAQSTLRTVNTVLRMGKKWLGA